MKKTRRVLSFLLCLVMVFSLFAGMPIIPGADLSTEAEAATSNTNPAGGSEWVCAWHTSMMWLNSDSSSNISLAVGVLSTLPQRTFRTRIQTTMGGDTIRLVYSNEYGTAPLNIDEITVALGDPSDVNKVLGTDENNMVKLTEGYTVPAGETLTISNIDVSKLNIDAMDYVTVSTCITNMNRHGAGITGGLIGGKTNYLGMSLDGSGNYNHTEKKNMSSGGLVNPIELSNSDATGDYNIIPFLKEIDVKRDTINGVTNTNDAYATVIFGDSTVANNIPLFLENKLLTSNIDGVSFVWSAVKGNEFILNGQSSVSDDDKNGPAMAESGLNRAYKDAINLPGVKKIIVKLGINDILHTYCANMQGDFNHNTAAREIIAAYKEFIDLAHAKGIEVYFYELSPWDGYTRNGNLPSSATNATEFGKIELVRQQVNAWLVKYGTAYDPIDKDCYTNDELNSGVVTLGDNYGTSSFAQNCDLKYENSPTNTYSRSRHYAYDHSQPFDSFGYISLEAMNNGTALQGMYTTDGIHYSTTGQSKVANLTPNSIFMIQEEVQQDGQSVTIPGIFTATTQTSLQNGQYYYICNTAGDTSKNTPAGNQESTGLLATSKAAPTTDYEDDIDSLDYYGLRGGKYEHYSATLDLTSTEVTIQRGNTTAPYIVSNGIDNYAQWKAENKSGTWFWQNTGSQNYLAWYFPGASVGSLYGRYRFTTGTIAVDPNNTSGVFNNNVGWYTFTNVKAAGRNDDPYSVYLYYDAILDDKYFSYGLRTLKNTNNGTYVWAAMHEHAKQDYPVALFVGANENVTCTMDLKAPANWGAEVSKDNYIVANRNGTDNVCYLLSDNMPNSDGTRTTHTNDGSSTTLANRADGNGKFEGYTYGHNQAIYWKSSNTNVATVGSDGKLTFSGTPGETVVTANFVWQEYDGKTYTWDNKNGSCYTDEEMTNLIGSTKPVEVNGESNGYHWIEIEDGKWVYTNYYYLTSAVKVTNVIINTDIIIDGENLDTYDKGLVSTGDTSSLEAFYTVSSDGYELPAGGHWAWTSTGSAVSSITQDGSLSATLIYSGNTGTSTVTVTYVDANGNPIDFGGGTYITESIEVSAEAKPMTVDIQINGNVDDSNNPVFEEIYANNNSDIGDTITLKAHKTAGNQTFTDYSWTVYTYDGEKLVPDDSVVSVAGSSVDTATLTVNGEGTAYVKVDGTYNDGSGEKHAEDYITVTIGFFKTESKNVVVDFALPVNIDLSKLAGGRTVNAISAEKGDVTENTFYDDAQYTATSIDNASYKATLANSVMTYQPAKISDGSVNTVYYQAVTNAGKAYKCSHVDIIPATIVYYEDSIGSINYINGKIDGVVTSEGQHGAWSVVGTDMSQSAVQSIANDIYGYDPAYENNCSTYSMGSVHKVTVSAINNPNTKFSGTANPGAWPTASFSFTGTGFDIISLTNTDTGLIKVKVEGNGITKNLTVNEYYGYTSSKDAENPYVAYIWEYRSDGRWHIMRHADASEELNYGIPASQDSLNAYIEEFGSTRPKEPKESDTFVTYKDNYEWTPAETEETLYQIPTIKVSGLPYGSYTVTITPTFGASFDMNDDGHYSFSLDAIRVYGAVSSNPAYVEANEAEPEIYSIRSLLLDQSAYQPGKNLTGIAFIDGITEDGTIGAYDSYGPNNEVYLKPGQAIAFEIEKSENVASIQVGFKTLNGEVSVNVNGKESFTTASNTDMYRDITACIGEDGVVTITNDGSNIVTLTTLKITKGAGIVMAAPMVNEGVVLKSKAMVRNVMLAGVPVEEAPFEPSVSIDVADKATVGDEVTVKVSTSEDVAFITVNGEKVEEHDANFVWTYTTTAEAEGEMTFEVAAYDFDGEAAEAVQTANVTVEAAPVVPDEPEDPDEPDEPGTQDSIIVKVINAIKSFFGKLFGR